MAVPEMCKSIVQPCEERSSEIVLAKQPIGEKTADNNEIMAISLGTGALQAP